ncbi:MAG: hypothetical protein JW779_08790 [Candidatus Thorarchaeota archaeon]|nr:hypothetical protein [Candidatus Thorarchaeota archaeon]
MGIIIGSFQGLIKKAGGGGAKSLLLTSPNGSESWISGSSHDIVWEASGIETLDLYYSINNGVDWSLIDENITASLGSYSWTIPVAISSNCLVKIIEHGGEIEDQSDAVFSIDIGWLVASYVNNSGSPLAWHDAEEGIAETKIGLVNGLYHTLANDSHGSNNADKMTNRYGSAALQIETADVGVMDTLGSNNAFTYIEKIKMPASGLGYTRHAEGSAKGWIVPHEQGSTAKFYLYVDGWQLKTVNLATQTIPAGEYVFICCSYINGTGYVKMYNASGTLLQSASASWTGTYQVPSAVWKFETNGANDHYCSHFGYINKVASDTDIANFIAWANTY